MQLGSRDQPHLFTARPQRSIPTRYPARTTLNYMINNNIEIHKNVIKYFFLRRVFHQSNCLYPLILNAKRECRDVNVFLRVEV